MRFDISVDEIYQPPPKTSPMVKAMVDVTVDSLVTLTLVVKERPDGKRMVLLPTWRLGGERPAAITVPDTLHRVISGRVLEAVGRWEGVADRPSTLTKR